VTWYYAVGGDRLGPIDEAAFDRLIADGTIAADTLVWRAGMAGWQPLREVRPAAVASPPPQPPTQPALQPPVQPPVGQPSVQPTADPAAPITPSAAPAAGPPRRFDFLPPPSGATPLPGAPTIDPDAAFARIEARSRPFNAIDTIRRGAQLVFADPLTAVGVTLVGAVTLAVCGFLPCVGTIAQIIVTGPVFAGWQLYWIRRLRGVPATVWDVFESFSSPLLSQLVLEYIVVMAASLVLMLPLLGLVFATMAAAVAAQDFAMLVMTTGWTVVFLIAVTGSIYLTVSWMFALPLILDKGLPFWPAMQLSRRVAHRFLLPLVGMLLLCWLIMVAGLLALCVGILISAPIVIASMTCAYEDLFGDAPTS
jgi:hypothetical protein